MAARRRPVPLAEEETRGGAPRWVAPLLVLTLVAQNIGSTASGNATLDLTGAVDGQLGVSKFGTGRGSDASSADVQLAQGEKGQQR